MKNKWLVKLCVVCALVGAFECSASKPRVDIEVTIVGEDGAPIEGAQVAGGYGGVRVEDDKVSRSITDERGKADLSGRSHYSVAVVANKKGYYESGIEVNTFEKIGKKFVYSDQERTIVLKPIGNPIAMYARLKQEIRIRCVFRLRFACGGLGEPPWIWSL